MAVTIQDVAKAASVSVATVSRVVNNIPLVSEDTKQRVLAAIDELGYEPNEVARSLKVRKTKTIGILLDDITKPQYTSISRGVTDACWIYEYNVILANTDGDIEKEKKYLKVFMQKQCDGVLVVNRKISDELATQLASLKVPVVLGAVSDREKKFANVSIDNRKASFEAVEYLHEKGHNDIGYIMGNREEFTVCADREAGFWQAVEKYGLNAKEEWCIESEKKKLTEQDVKEGYDAMQKILDSKRLPTAVFAANDEIAFGAMTCIEERGLKVPHDISIIGFNDYWLSEWVKPQITTISHPMYDVGAVCARLLIKKIEDEDASLDAKDSIVIPHDIILRQTVRGLND